MSTFVREIPLIELLLVFAMLGLGGLGYLSLIRQREPSDQLKHRLGGKWILAGLVGVAILAITLLFAVSLVQV